MVMEVEFVGGPMDGKVYAAPDDCMTITLSRPATPAMLPLSFQEGEDGIREVPVFEVVLPIRTRPDGRFFVVWKESV